MAADLTNDGDLARVERRIAAAPDLELLVNNAGFGTHGRYFDIPVDSQDQMHRLHVMATMRLCHAALSGMAARRKGGIINVSSVAAFGQSNQNVSYCSTKAWMNSFTEGLYVELKSAGSPVRVQALCPGFTITEFHDAMRFDRKQIPAWLWMPAEEVVDASLRGLAQDKLIVVPGAIYKLVVMAHRAMPQWMRLRVTLLMAKRGRHR
jgi:short-subunit dehydrogenase